MNTEWSNLRSFNGSQKDAFEELFCQLADDEPIENKIQFIRVAAPDAGKEAYCILSTGEEYGWQAKFFQSMSSSQWSQLDESVETVLSKHPNLTRYYICTPLDREDPRIDGQEWFMDKWKARVAKWQAKAEQNKRSVEFVYWGNYELFKRLNQSTNAGRLNFWFQKIELTNSWFDSQLDNSICNLGNRYSPKVNFQLPIAKIFHGLARDYEFKLSWSERFDELKNTTYKAIRLGRDERMNDHIEAFKKDVEALFNFEVANRPQRLSEIDSTNFLSKLGQLSHDADQIVNRFDELNEIEHAKKASSKLPHNTYTNRFSWEIENFRNVSSSLDQCSEYLDGPEVLAAQIPAVLLTGSAGMGKSHLLADIAEKRRGANLPTILILGQHFTTLDDPWTQILRLLQLTCNRDTFLATLNAYGEAIGSRILFFIDAINEGNGRFIWEQHIRGFLREMRRYPWLGVTLSVRSSYEQLLVPKDVVEEYKLTKLVHQGFQAVEHDAVKRFFSYYGLILPNIPLLHPEFSNPLFLHLFCRGLQKKGFDRMPDGYEGITAVLTLQLEAVDNVLSAKCGYPSSLRLTQKVVDDIAAKLFEIEARSLSYEEAFYWLL